MTPILINGNFLARRLTGIERFAFETLKNLDSLLTKDDDWAIYIPANAGSFPEYKNIKIIISEKSVKSFPNWDLFVFKKACRKLGRTGLNFSNTAPLGKNCGYAFLHDIYCHDCPQDFKGLKPTLIRLYSLLNAGNIARNALKVFTVSDFSKKQIQKAYKVPESRIEVIPNGWDHFKAVESDASVFEKFPVLKERPFYFTLGSLQRRKNLKWVLKYAENHPDETFAVSGRVVTGYKSEEIGSLSALKNVVLLGYLSDGEVKALMKKCRAFVFPSLYEGFGIPPLEALSCGARVVVSNAASLPEIYGKSAVYIDPDNWNVELKELLKTEIDSSELQKVLEKYTYPQAARKLLDVVRG